MKTAFFFIFLFAVAYCADNPDEEATELLDNVAAEEARSCVEGGKDCKNDCQCCGKWSYCKCPLWGAFGCSCVIGDSMVCVRKKNDCKNPAVMNTPPGGCFSSRRGNNRRG